MDKRRFGNTDLQVTPLGFGAAPIGLLATDRDRAGRIMNLLLDNGMNLIDTAAGYANAEIVIGETVGHRRDQYVLVSKCGHKVEGVSGEPWSAQLIAESIDRSLRRMQTDHLDVMLLHSCTKDVLEKGEALAALVQAKQAGKIRFAGYSGDNETAAFAATLGDVSVIQTSVNIADQRNIDVVLPNCRKNDLGVMAKRPIANAAWRSTDEQQGFYKNYAQNYSDRLAKMNLDPERLGLSGPDAWAELALRFTLSQPGVHVAIIGTTNPDNARKNIEHANKRPLSADQIQQVRSAFRQADPQGEWMSLE